jgi:hypothetical protein
MDARAALLALEDSFVHRHVAPTETAIAAMLDAVGLLQLGSSSISVQACAAFGEQDAELTTLSGLRADALRGRHGTGQKLLI